MNLETDQRICRAKALEKMADIFVESEPPHKFFNGGNLVLSAIIFNTSVEYCTDVDIHHTVRDVLYERRQPHQVDRDLTLITSPSTLRVFKALGHFQGEQGYGVRYSAKSKTIEPAQFVSHILNEL